MGELLNDPNPDYSTNPNPNPTTTKSVKQMWGYVRYVVSYSNYETEQT